jgi:hypothetical protein
MEFKNYKFTIALAILVLMIMFSIIVYANRYDWTPVDIPITKLDSKFKTNFTADLLSAYSISMKFKPNTDMEYWDCVFRRFKASKKCNNEKDFISVKWSIEKESEDQVTVSKQGEEMIEGDLNRFSLTSFNARPGETNRVSIILKGPKLTISQTRPRLIIEIDPLKQKDTMILNLLLYFYTIILALITIASYFVEPVIRNKIL